MGNALQGIPSVISDERPRVWRYSHSAGPIRSRFLLNLRDQQKITGTKCPTCGKVYVPARSTCLKCFVNMTEWVDVKYDGVVEAYTVVHKSSRIHKTKAPFAFAVIKLDGADTGLVHMLGETDLDKIEIGMRVRAIFSDELKGDITDIKYFKPMNGS